MSSITFLPILRAGRGPGRVRPRADGGCRQSPCAQRILAGGARAGAAALPSPAGAPAAPPRTDTPRADACAASARDGPSIRKLWHVTGRAATWGSPTGGRGRK
ncbi:hypothetical protein GCM10010218_21100 [Streptomyces mashuensis]|uniref:Uncharacterized protein n=1 Tax=Streptomyces mashuensis TaxID=33904 RepID=A0A919B151_9ACTN|nr:hypothetical protein GCM10010218_21100 [Streptomyces mashuensis]